MPFERQKSNRCGGVKIMKNEVNENDAEDSDLENYLVPLFAEDDEQDMCANNGNNVEQLATVQFKQNDSAESTLDNFRREWKSELNARLKESKKTLVGSETIREQELHDAATKLFLEGVDCERRGDMWEAVQRYMGAVRMVPDIESRVYNDSNPSIPQNFSTTDLNLAEADDCRRSRSIPHFGFREVGNLANVLQQRIANSGKFCEPECSESNLDEPCPIALLPVELLAILMRYVVGSELDVRCLEMLSMTSAGFYLLARDEDLWHTICRKTFGPKRIDSITFDLCISWRQMYVTYPHVYLHGVYIGKTTYLRNGEASFQDQFYKPWHIVVYYRILKFFADGTVIMITTSEAPAQIVGCLKTKAPRLTGVLTGRYWFVEQDRIAAQFRRHNEKSVQRSRRSQRLRHTFIPYEIRDQKFDMKLYFGDGKKRRAHCALQVEEYNCTVTYLDGKVSHSSLDASDHQAYPPLLFSRVKSYAVPDFWDEILA